MLLFLNLGGKGSFKNILDIYHDYKKHIYKANFFFFLLLGSNCFIIDRQGK